MPRRYRLTAMITGLRRHPCPRSENAGLRAKLRSRGGRAHLHHPLRHFELHHRRLRCCVLQEGRGCGASQKAVSITTTTTRRSLVVFAAVCAGKARVMARSVNMCELHTPYRASARSRRCRSRRHDLRGLPPRRCRSGRRRVGHRRVQNRAHHQGRARRRSTTRGNRSTVR